MIKNLYRLKAFFPVFIFLLGLCVSSYSLAVTYPMPREGDLIGEEFMISTKGGERLVNIARRYDMSLHEMIEANPHIKPIARLKEGQRVLIPARFILPKRKFRKPGAIVINLPELRLYYFTPDGRYIMTYPVGVGRRGWRTPTTSTYVVKKAQNPDWHVPKSIKRYTYEKYGRMLPDVIPGGTPENPLGAFAIYLGKAGILVHGTNVPNSIGKFVSSGCIRLAARDIEELYYNVIAGAKVFILNHAHKAGWYEDKLYLESHVPVVLPEAASDLNHSSEARVLKAALSYKAGKVDWELVHQVASHRNGVPRIVGTSIH